MRSPQKTLTAVAEESDLHTGNVIVAALDGTSGRVRGVRTVVDPGEDDPAALAAALGDAAHELAGSDDPAWGEAPGTILVTLLCRPGPPVVELSDHRIDRAWLRSNHGLRVLHGDVFVVTPHGWCSLDDDAGGAVPRTRPDPAAPRPGGRPVLRLVTPGRTSRFGPVHLVR